MGLEAAVLSHQLIEFPSQLPSHGRRPPPTCWRGNPSTAVGLSTELWGMPEAREWDVELPKGVPHATEWIAAGFSTRVTGGSEQQAAAHPKMFCPRQTGDNKAGLQSAPTLESFLPL